MGRVILLIFAIWACATSVIFIKDSSVGPVALAGWRLVLGAALLSPLVFRDRRRFRAHLGSAPLRRAVLPGVLLGVHFISWIAGARLTLAANASLIVNMVPVVMPFLLLVLLREGINRGEAAGTAVAMAGVAVLTWSDYLYDPLHFRGDVVCFVSMLLFAVYLALARRNRSFPSLWLYVVPVYLSGGLFCLLASTALWAIGLAAPELPAAAPWAFVSPLAGDWPWDLLMILGLALLPTILGHSTLNYCMKHMRGQFVSIATLGQFIFAGLMAYAYPGLRETPDAGFYPAAVLVVVGAAIALRATPPPEQRLEAGSAPEAD